MSSWINFFFTRFPDVLIREGKIKLEKNFLTLMTGDRPSFELGSEYWPVKTADGSLSPLRPIGQIKYGKDINALDAEAYLDSVVFGAAYEVGPGFTGDKKSLLDRLSDTDLHSRFLLENLS